MVRLSNLLLAVRQAILGVRPPKRPLFKPGRFQMELCIRKSLTTPGCSEPQWLWPLHSRCLNVGGLRSPLTHAKLTHATAAVAIASLLFLNGCGKKSDESLSVPLVAAQPAEPRQATAAPTPWKEETLDSGEFELEEGFRSLTLADFKQYFAKPPAAGSPSPWQEVRGAIVCFGKPKGYLYSKESFENFTLKLEFRYAPGSDNPAQAFVPNTGVLVYITEPHKQWPKCLEVQGRYSDVANIKPNGGASPFQIFEDEAARQQARKPIGDWNTLEIVSKAGVLTSRLNGMKVCENQPSDVSSGPIGLQSEDYEVHFRRLRIRAE